MALAAALTACGADPCAELVRKTCGESEACSQGRACLVARDLATRGVDSACAGALDNSLSYPACE